MSKFQERKKFEDQPLAQEFRAHEENHSEMDESMLFDYSVNDGSIQNIAQTRGGLDISYHPKQDTNRSNRDISEFLMSYAAANSANALSQRASSSKQSNHTQKNIKSAEYLPQKSPQDNRTEMRDIAESRDVIQMPDSARSQFENNGSSVFLHAHNQLKQAENDMKAVQEKHLGLVREIEGQFKTIERESLQHYEELINRFLSIAQNKVNEYKAGFERIQTENDEYKEASEAMIKRLEAEKESLLEERANWRDIMRAELEAQERRHQAEMTSLRETFESEEVHLSEIRQTLECELIKCKQEHKVILEKKKEEIVKLREQNDSLWRDINQLSEDMDKKLEKKIKEETQSALDLMIFKLEYQQLESEFSTYKINKENEISTLALSENSWKTNYMETEKSFESYKKESEEKIAELQKKVTQFKSMLKLEKPRQEVQNTSDNEADIAQKIEELKAQKDTVQAKIYAWMADFKALHGYTPTTDDRKQSTARPLFAQLVSIKKEISLLEKRQQESNASVIQNQSGVGKENLFTENSEETSARPKTVSPIKPQFKRVISQNQNSNNISVLSSLNANNASFDANNTTILGESPLTQSQNSTSFYNANIPPQSTSSSELNRLRAEIHKLREENSSLKLSLGNNFKESDAVTTLTQEINALKRDKALLKKKIISMQNRQSVSSNDTSTVAESNISMFKMSTDDLDRSGISQNKSVIGDTDTNLKIKELEESYQKLLKQAEETKHKEVQEIARLKDGIIQKITSSLRTLEEESKNQNADKKALSAQIEKLRKQCNELQQECVSLKELKIHMEQRIKQEVSERKRLHNLVEDMKGKVRVFCRVRPLSKSEQERNCKSSVAVIDEFNVSIETKNGPKMFGYDTCYGAHSTQDQIFEDTSGLIQSAIDGYNVCIFAYGQTGSGKTHTLHGSNDDPGITPRAIEELFKMLAPMQQYCDIALTCSMTELYMDNLIDLLATKDPKRPPLHLEIKEDSKGSFYIVNLSVHPVNSAEKLNKLITQGINNRKTSRTDMNPDSSRSHLILNIMIEIYNRHTDQRTLGKLSLVDLAGSERVNKANSTTKQLNEARAINKSLTALGDVISALSSQEKFIPYRNNKLTMLMRDCLGGTAKTLMFVTVSPADYNVEETLTSLFYASRVKQIVNENVKNIETKEISKLKDQLRGIAEERDSLRLMLAKGEKTSRANSIPNIKTSLGSYSSTPHKSDQEDSKYDDGPLNRIVISENMRF